MIMTRSEDLTQIGFCKVCQSHFMPGGHSDRERLLSVGVCHNCDFWLEKWQMRNDPNVVRVNGEHYIIGEPDDTIKGMGGQKFRIEFHDGREVFTDNLWSQGAIPADWTPWLFDNAIMEIMR